MSLECAFFCRRRRRRETSLVAGGLLRSASRVRNRCAGEHHLFCRSRPDDRAATASVSTLTRPVGRRTNSVRLHSFASFSLSLSVCTARFGIGMWARPVMDFTSAPFRVFLFRFFLVARPLVLGVRDARFDVSPLLLLMCCCSRRPSAGRASFCCVRGCPPLLGRRKVKTSRRPRAKRPAPRTFVLAPRLESGPFWRLRS